MDSLRGVVTLGSSVLRGLCTVVRFEQAVVDGGVQRSRFGGWRSIRVALARLSATWWVARTRGRTLVCATMEVLLGLIDFLLDDPASQCDGGKVIGDRQAELAWARRLARR